MIETVSKNDPSAAVFDIFQVKGQNLAGPEAALQHQKQHRPIALAHRGLQQLLDLRIRQRSRHARHPTQPHPSPYRTRRHTVPTIVATGVERVVIDAGLLGQNQIFVERRDGSQRAIDSRWRQPTVDEIGRERMPATRTTPSIPKMSQQIERTSRRKRLQPEVYLA